MSAIADWVRRQITRGFAYRSVFMDTTGQRPSRDGEIVLADLRWFCRAVRSTGSRNRADVIDPIAMAMAEGRREVWLRIQQHLHLDEAVLWRLREDAERRDVNAIS